jgi:cell division protein FtsW
MKIVSFTILGIIGLIFLGLLMVFNTTSADIIDQGVITYIPLLKQTSYICAGTAAGFWLFQLGYDKLLTFGREIYLFSIIMLICVFIPKIGLCLNGSSRWVSIFGVSIQPSEFMKVVFPIFYIYLIKRVGTNISFKIFCFWQVLLVIPILLIIIEPDNGTAFILITTLILLYFITKIRLSYWLIPTAIFSMGLLSAALSMPHVTARISSYLNPESDILGKGHQAYQAKIAAGCGFYFGRGLGESMQKYHYLPEARCDYIAAIYAEEFGFIGIVLLVSLYTLIAAMGFAIAFKTRDIYGHYLAVIYTFMISFGAFLNLGIVSGMLPSKGTNLPFFSSGGSSFLSNLFMIAIILSVYKKSNAVDKPTLRGNL